MTDAGKARAVRSLDPVTVRVRAANPSPLHLSGTNTYLIGDPGAGEVIVVDPGPDLPDHRAAVEAVIADLGVRVAAVVITHHHLDHSEAVGWAEQWEVAAYAFDPSRVPGAQPLADRATVPVAGVAVTARHLPGHCSDHVCLQIAETGVVLSGDHVLGEGTTFLAWPDGDLGQYLASLQELKAMRPSALYPGHGEVVELPAERIDELAAHRAQRTVQITAALASGAQTVPDIVAQVYPQLDPRLRSAAGRSVSAHLSALEQQGMVRRAGERWHGT
jgi:glyoxylase-like metal-dependent hydrolase (beta-lactamase superfamily II)